MSDRVSWALRFIGLPVLLAWALGSSADRLPWSGGTAAVFLVDGQAYFGQLADPFWSDTLTLRDVYYLEDASKSTTGLQIGVVKRGREAHEPADGMRIKRDRVLVVERVGNDSPVLQAILTQRALDRSVPR